MSKRKRKRAEQAPARLFREFKDYPVAQVIETARMLYSLRRPFPLDSKLEFHWNSLVRQAFDFLDNLYKARARVAEYRHRVAAAYRNAEKETALAEKLPLNANGNVLFNAAVKFITRQKEHLDRALERFEWLVLSNPYFAPLFSKCPATKRELRALFARWRKDGFPHGEVKWLRSLYDAKAYRRDRIATAGRAKKRRAPWSEKKIEKVALESSAREVERQRKVDALRRLARGEIK